MSAATLEAWIDGRTPSVPAAFRATVQPSAREAEVSAAAWVREARAALRRMDGDPAAREAAFALLAADGFATWACEVALEADDPGAALVVVLDALME